MASQLRAGSQMSSGAFCGFATPQYIPPTISSGTEPSSPPIPDLEIPGFSFTPLSQETNPISSTLEDTSEEDVETLSQKETRLTKVTLHIAFILNVQCSY